MATETPTRFRNWIDGKYCDAASGQWLESYDPSRGELPAGNAAATSGLLRKSCCQCVSTTMRVRGRRFLISRATVETKSASPRPRGSR